MTTDELVAEVYTEWGESSTNSIVSPAQVTAFANRGARRLCLEGNLLMTCKTTTITVGQETYPLPADYLKLDAACLRNTPKARWLEPMDVADRDPGESQGTPERYWIWGELSSGLNVPVIGLARIPDETIAAGLRMYIRRQHVKMVHSSEGAMVNPEVNEAFQGVIIDYCLMRIYGRLGPDYRTLYVDQRRDWDAGVIAAKQYVNPLTYDYPVARRDTARYSSDWPIP